MQKIVEELKQLIPFKETTGIGDTILIVAKQPHFLAYAHIDDIERDSSRKDEWWHVHFTMLTIPLQKLTWTLRTEQMTGKEIFTMGGEERFIKALEFTRQKSPQEAGGKALRKKVSALKRIK